MFSSKGFVLKPLRTAKQQLLKLKLRLLEIYLCRLVWQSWGPEVHSKSEEAGRRQGKSVTHTP